MLTKWSDTDLTRKVAGRMQSDFRAPTVKEGFAQVPALWEYDPVKDDRSDFT